MSATVKVYQMPGGERIVINTDDASAKAEALRLGLLSGLESSLREHEGQRSAGAITRAETCIVAIIAWAGFTAADNGWVSLTATPASERTTDCLLRMVYRLIERPAIRFAEGVSPWMN